jgi:hypothetical protein
MTSLTKVKRLTGASGQSHVMILTLVVKAVQTQEMTMALPQVSNLVS